VPAGRDHPADREIFVPDRADWRGGDPAHTMDTLLVYPDPPPPELAQCLDLDGWAWKSVADPDAAMSDEPNEGWAGAIVVADTDPEGAFALCRRLRKVEMPLAPLLLLVGVLVPAVESAASWNEERAAAVEDAVQRLVAAGADEEDLRSTIAAAIHLGRRSAGD